MTNRDLDLPTQQQLLAQYRCDEISKLVFDVFTDSIKSLGPRLHKGEVIGDFGKSTDESYKIAIASFAKDASRYHSATYKSKESEFVAKLKSHIYLLFTQQLRNLHKISLASFQQKVADRLKAGDEDFSLKLSECKTSVIDHFNTIVQESNLVDSKWSSEEYHDSLLSNIEDICVQKRTEALNRVFKTIEKQMLNKLADPVKLLMNDPAPTLWSEILAILVSVIEETKDILKSKLQSNVL